MNYTGKLSQWLVTDWSLINTKRVTGMDVEADLVWTKCCICFAWRPCTLLLRLIRVFVRSDAYAAQSSKVRVK